MAVVGGGDRDGGGRWADCVWLGGSRDTRKCLRRNATAHLNCICQACSLLHTGTRSQVAEAAILGQA